MTRFIRPFWFFDIDKIERWLSYMAGQGQHLVKFRPLPGTFLFESGVPQDRVLKMGYAPNREQDGTVKKGSGWEEVARHKNLYFLASTMPAEQIRVFPARDGLTNRILLLLNRIILAYWTILMLFLVGAAVYLLLLASGVITPTFEDYLRWRKYRTIIFWASMLVLVGIHVSLTNISHKLLHSEEWFRYLVLPEGLTKKVKIGWFRSPDKLEQWLEKMERQGYYLRGVSRAGLTFSFARGKARKVKYCVDFQFMVDRSYYVSHREAGWNLIPVTRGSFAVWSIWAKQYQDQAPQPLYTDYKHMLRHALFVAAQAMAPIPFAIAYYVAVLRATIERPEFMVISVICGLGVLIFLSLIIQIWLYYRRTKKQASTRN